MPKLTDKDIRHFEAKLRQRRDDLRSQIQQALTDAEREDFAELAGRVHDAGEESVAELVMSTNFTQVDREVSELRDVEAALERIRNGEYGVCQECGGEIGKERLEAYPTAKRCIRCQTLYERSRRGGHDPTPSL